MLEVPLRKRRARFTVWYSHQASAGDDIQAGQFKDCMLRLMAHVTARKREAPLSRLGNFDLTHLMGSLSVSNYRHWLTLSARGLSPASDRWFAKRLGSSLGRLFIEGYAPQIFNRFCQRETANEICLLQMHQRRTGRSIKTMR